MTKTDELKADLDKLGVNYDPSLHWRQLERLLDQAREALGEPDGVTTATITAPTEVKVPAKVPVELPAETMPETNPMEGDKTPALVAWRRKNWTAAQFDKVYAGRKIPS